MTAEPIEIAHHFHPQQESADRQRLAEARFIGEDSARAGLVLLSPVLPFDAGPLVGVQSDGYAGRLFNARLGCSVFYRR